MHSCYTSFIGTTSACAENTHPGEKYSTTGENYLRVRGEYWGRYVTVTVLQGTTSACAENTLNELGLL